MKIVFGTQQHLYGTIKKKNNPQKLKDSWPFIDQYKWKERNFPPEQKII